jgi:signal transduction histidine kinase/CheY-like chemotaxis protein/GGDEF domain-containing protein
MFIPVICTVLVFMFLINLYLHVSGTVRALNNNAVDILFQNVQTRGDNLERLMVHYWSNIDRLEYEVLEAINAYLRRERITIDELLGNGEREIALLDIISDSLIDAIRVSATTGIFIYFLNGEGLTEEVHRLNGLYLRDYSALTNIHANLIFLRGHINIPRRHNISTDSLWEEYFTFDPRHEDIWRGFANPQKAAQMQGYVPSVNMSYWNGPHLFNSYPRVDANMQITYNRPLILDGRTVAIIGTDMQMTHIDRHLPPRDLDTFQESGYVLLRYDADRVREDGSFTGDVLRIAGGFMNRFIGDFASVNINMQRNSDSFTLAERSNIHGVYFPLRIYNPSSPFFNETWILTAMSTERSLFAMTKAITRDLLIGSVVAVLLIFVLLVFVIKGVTKPIGLLINQLKVNKGDSPVEKTTNAYEIALLCDTINNMIERRLLAERHIREERQRYLLALESSSDTFIEYDIANDTLSYYYFTDTPQQTPEVRSIADFKSKRSDFFHPEDTPDFYLNNNHEVRIKASYFDHIKGVEADKGYYWFFIKSIIMRDENNEPEKIIGTAGEMTAQKIARLAEIESTRRDENTGFLNRNFGLEQVRRIQPPYALSHIIINNFDRLELTYGIIFGGIYIAQFAHKLSEIVGNDGFIVRTSNDEFLICYDLPPEEAEHRAQELRKAFDLLYTGEAADIPLSITINDLDDIHCFEFSKYAAPEKINPNDKENITNFALELYERTASISCATKILLGLIGRLFGLDRAVVCAYDPNFGTSQATHAWYGEGVGAPHSDIRKVPHKGFIEFAKLLDNDTCVYTSESTPDGTIATMLCIPSGEAVSVYCCALYEESLHTGSVLFMSANPEKEWTEHDKALLHSVAKIIASFINVEKSRSASQAKSRFLSRVSHEIRTPMNAILGMTHIAMDAADNDNQLRVNDCLNKINVSANYLLSLINDVLEVSRIESGKTMQIDVKPFSLAAFTQAVEAVIRFTIESKGITFRVVNNVQNDYVMGNDYRLKQVIINLLGNANKFTHSGGTITFTVEEREAGCYRFSVKDTGVGIPQDKHKSIFNPFEQAETRPGTEQQGTGLGLSISRNIISAMDSTIELKSEPGRGSEFSFVLKLPLAELSEACPEVKKAVDTSAMRGKRVLAVDDVDVNLEIVSFILENVGILVETAVNGREAVDMFNANPPNYYDAVLMDIQMPVMDGIAAARLIRGMSERADAASIPIIALTANAFDEDLKKSVESGMNEHISKPINGDDLLSIINALIGGKLNEG